MIELNTELSNEVFTDGEERENLERTDYRILNVKEFLEFEGDRQVIYLDPLIRKESILLITGTSGVGKTMFSLGLCKSVVNGNRFGEWVVKNRTKVLYVDGELPTYIFQERVRGFNLGEGFYVLSSSINREKDFTLVDSTFRDRIKRELIEKSIGVVVFDNLLSLTPHLDENSKREWDGINQYLLDLRRHGVTSLIIHHTTKSKTEQRGTSGRTDNIDVWLNLESQSNVRSENLKVKVVYKKWRYERTILLNNNIFLMNDNYEWVQGRVERELDEKKMKMLKLMSEGKSQIEISRELDTQQPYISKMKKVFRKEGLLDESGKLTPKSQGILGLR